MRLSAGNVFNSSATVPADTGWSSDKKPLLLVFPFGLLSHYLRCLVLARQFRPYFRVLFVHHPGYAPFIAKEGFDTFECLSLDADQAMACVQKFDFSWMNENAMEPVFRDQVRAMALLQPAAVLGDCCPTLKMAAEKAGVPYVSLMNGYMSRYYAHTRSLSQVHPARALLSSLPQPVINLFTTTGESIAFYQVHKAFRKIRKCYALTRKFSYLEELEGDWNLVCDLEALFPQKKLPANYQVIAPLFYQSDDRSTGIADLLDPGKQTIFVSMGSSGDWTRVTFLNDACFSKYNVITAGDSKRVLHAPHITATGFVHVQELFPFTDLVICHGGNGTIYQALYYGIPVLCKTAHFEQEWNAVALERAHAGRSLDHITELQDYIRIVDATIANKKSRQHAFRAIMDRQAGELHQVIRMVSAQIIAGSYTPLPH